MKIIICDDNARDRSSLRRLLAQFFHMQHETAEYAELTSGEALLDYLNTATADILFLDIYMAQIDGIETARKLRHMGCDSGLFFISSSKDPAVDSYKVQADYYLLKPVTYEELSTAMFSWIRKMKNRQKLFSHTLSVICNHHTVEIPVVSIIYIEVYNRILILHCLDGDYETYSSLSSVMEQLANDSFIRVHRSYIVNLHFIKAFEDRSLTLKNDLPIPVSRQHLRPARTAWQTHLSKLLWEEDLQ